METETTLEVSDVQLPSCTSTQKLPAAKTVIDCVVAPVLQMFPVALLLVSVTLSPAQKVVGPLAVMDGVAGCGLLVTLRKADVSEVQDPSNHCTQ
jgi:hypothetical protein